MVAVLLTLVVLIVLVATFTWITYNKFVARRNTVQASWRQVDTDLQRRADLVPNLVSTVGAYATHERETLTAVTAARAGLRGTDVNASAAADGVLAATVGRLLAVAEQYPDLKADKGFRQLQSELADLEKSIAFARRVYNDEVRGYNTGLEQFPGLLVAGALHFKPEPLFEAVDEARSAPVVRF